MAILIIKVAVTPPGIAVDDHDDANGDHDDEDEDDPDDHSGRALVSVRRLALSRQASFSLLLIESPMRLREA